MTWQPVPDGLYVHDSIIDGRIVLKLDGNGQDITIIGPDDMYETINLSPFAERLCRQVPDAASVPMLELTRLLELCKRRNELSGRFSYEIARVERWLEQMKGATDE